MVDGDRLSYPLPKSLSKAGICKVQVEAPYLVTYVKDENLDGVDRELFLVYITGYYKRDRYAIRYAAERFLEYNTAQLLVHYILQSDYFLEIQSTNRVLQSLRDLTGYQVAVSILSSSTSRNKNIGVDKMVLSNTIAQVIDVSAREADRIIDRLKKAGKLIDSSSDSLVLG
jgi:hypothetical protein